MPIYTIYRIKQFYTQKSIWELPSGKAEFIDDHGIGLHQLAGEIAGASLLFFALQSPAVYVSGAG
jgi:hypothetical protein